MSFYRVLLLHFHAWCKTLWVALFLGCAIEINLPCHNIKMKNGIWVDSCTLGGHTEIKNMKISCTWSFVSLNFIGGYWQGLDDTKHIATHGSRYNTVYCESKCCNALPYRFFSTALVVAPQHPVLINNQTAEMVDSFMSDTKHRQHTKQKPLNSISHLQT